MDRFVLVLALLVGVFGLAVARQWVLMQMVAGVGILAVLAVVSYRALLRAAGILYVRPQPANVRRTQSFRDVVFGPPLPSDEMPQQTVGKLVGLAVFASDVLSSVAYATEEILVVLAAAGAAYFGLSIPISIAISALLLMLTVSYRQTIFAYPSGGGAYVVARDNLGEGPAQTAGAALLSDYVLTVSVSVAAGVAQIASAFPALSAWRVQIAVGAIIVMMLINLRGVRESGATFAIPTYFFVLMMLGMLGAGFYQMATGQLSHVTGAQVVAGTMHPFTILLLLRAFSSGAVAVTGTEAVSNGITAFREPKARNAAATMAWMSILIGTMFVGTTVLAHRVGAVPLESETVISQLARTIFGAGPLHVIMLAATTVILIMAANTAFADFPRLCALHAADGFLPRQLTYRGSRLVFSWGIVALSVVASLLVIAFRADVSSLIPLYAIGVFLSFTMSQTGMVVRWRKIGRLSPTAAQAEHGALSYDPQWRTKQAVNAAGAVLTGLVTLVFAVTKFSQGAWIVVILIPGLVWIFFRIHRHYQDVRRRLSVKGLNVAPATVPVIHLVLISDVHAAALRQVQFVQSLGQPWQALHVATSEEKAEAVQRKWARFFPGEPLIVLPSPVRDLIGPLREYVERLRAAHPETFIHVVVAQIVMESVVEQALHQNATVIFKLALQQIPMVAVTDVAYPLHPARARAGIIDIVPGTEHATAT